MYRFLLEDGLPFTCSRSASTATTSAAAAAIEKGANGGSTGNDTGGNASTDQSIARRLDLRNAPEHGVLIVQVGEQVIGHDGISTLGLLETLCIVRVDGGG